MTKEEKQQDVQFKEYLEKKRETVMDLELNARYQKATYDTMYYTLEADKIREPYMLYLEKEKDMQAEIEKVITSSTNKEGV